MRSSIPRRRHVKLPLSKMKWNLVLDKQNRVVLSKTRSHFGQGSESARSRLFIPLFMKLGSDWKSAMEIVIFSKRKLARGRCLKRRVQSIAFYFGQGVLDSQGLPGRVRGGKYSNIRKDAPRCPVQNTPVQNARPPSDNLSNCFFICESMQWTIDVFLVLNSRTRIW